MLCRLNFLLPQTRMSMRFIKIQKLVSNRCLQLPRCGQNGSDYYIVTS